MATNPDQMLKLMFNARRQMEACLDDLFGDRSASPGGGWRPPTDVYECEDTIVIKVEVSGLRADEAEVVVQKNLVVVRGERQDYSPHRKRAFHQMEIRYGKFERRVLIDVPFDGDAITYKYRDGFLEVVIPKKSAPQPRKVQMRI